MQTVREEALDDRASSVHRIAGRGVCCNCESEIFQIVIYSDGSNLIACADPQCRTVWASIGEEPQPITHISPTVEGGGHE